MALQDSAGLVGCCAATYSHPAVLWVLGESLHPGGLALTGRVAGLLALGPSSTLLDAGCGRGASAVYLAKTLGCRVVGVSLEREGIVASREQARRQGVAEHTEFVEGDLLEVPLGEGAFDAALMECVLSIIPEKDAALRRIGAALRPGGRLAITDVTVNGPLPDDLRGLLAVVGCVGDARSLEGYAALAAGAGLTVETRQDLKDTAAQFLRELKGKLLVAEIGVKVGRLPVEPALVEQAKRLLAGALSLVQDGVLGYGLILARKPA